MEESAKDAIVLLFLSVKGVRGGGVLGGGSVGGEQTALDFGDRGEDGTALTRGHLTALWRSGL